MAMNQGVDAQVQNRVDAYRSNPQQLMQMYQQNQELVDLLALQKLKSEKESAAREMQMQMQQQPGTIAQQREQEVLQLTKNELAQQTQGVLQRKQQQQQTNLQRVAQGGLGALAQQGPAPAPAPQGQPQGQPMPRMAGGGIVAFQPGGEVQSGTPFGRFMSRTFENARSNMDDAALRQRVQTLYGPYAAPVGGLFQQSDTNRARAREIIERLQAGELSPEEMQQLVAAYPTFRENAARVTEPAPAPTLETTLGDPVDDAPRVAPAVAAEGAQYDPAGDRPDILDPKNNSLLDQMGESPSAAIAPPAAPTGGLTSLLDQMGESPSAAIAPPAAPATAEQAIQTPPPPASGGAGLAGLAGGAGSMGGAESALMRGVGISDKVLGREEKAGRYADMEAQLAELDAELYDPEAERRQQLQAFLIGTAGATNIGYAMAGGAAAAINLENRQKQNQRSRMVDRLALSERGMTLDSELGRAALSLGQQMFADFNANQRIAMSAAATLGAARLRAVADQAQLDFDREKEANAEEFRYAELEVRKATNAIEAARNEELAITRRVEGVLTATRNLVELSSETYKQGAKLFNVEQANYELSLLTPDNRNYETAREKAKLAEADANAYATSFLEQHGVNDQLEALQRRLYELYELEGMDAMPGLDPKNILNIEQQ